MAIYNDTPLAGIIQSNDNYLRIKTLLNHAGYGLYIKLLCDSVYGGFSSDAEEIYKQLLEYKCDIELMKDKGDISEEDYHLIYTPTEETNFNDFSLSLLHKLCQICVHNFPTIESENAGVDDEKHNGHTNGEINNGEVEYPDDKSIPGDEITDSSYTEHGKLTYLDLLQRLQDIANDKRLQKQVNRSRADFESKWDEIISLLTSLDYDIQKVESIRSAENLDDCRKYRPALIRGQAELLMNECMNFLKITEVNMITLGRLLNNLKEALTLAKEDNIEKISPFQEMKDLRESIEISANMLKIAEQSIVSLFGDLKFWKDKNVEGDVIMIDEMLNKLSIQVRKQNRSVSEYFNSVSFEIVKIKEKVNFEDDNIRYVKASEHAGKERKISIGFVNIGI